MQNRFKDLREDKELTQRDMAELLNVAQSTYSDYENENINVPLSVLRKLALFYHTSVDYLLGLTDNPVPYERSRHK